MSRPLRRHAECLNCGAPVTTDFCGQCGQENTDYHVSLRRLLGDLADELLQVESRLWRTLWTLVRRPGLLTLEYNSGRRVRYTTPLRLYLLASVAFFAIMSLVPASAGLMRVEFDDAELAELSAAPPPGAFFGKATRSRFLALARLGSQERTQRAQQAIEHHLPQAMALLLPWFALLTWLLARRPRRLFVEHLVFALHLHALAFAIMVPLAPWRNPGIDLVAMILVLVWALLAAHRVFAESWLRTLIKAGIIGFCYTITLALTIAAVSLLGLWFS